MSQSSAFNLLAPILESAARHPDRRAMAALDDALTYRQLGDMIANFARHMERHGIDRGARVALSGDHPLVMTGLALACALIGCAWVRGSPPALAQPVLRLTHCLHLGPPPARPGRARPVPVTADWTRPPAGEAAAGAPPAPFACHRSARETWMIANSSGTTGDPKYMELAAGSIWRRGMDQLLSFTTDAPVFVSLFPTLSTLSLVPAMQVLATGGTVAYVALADIFGGLAVDTVLGSPNQYLDFMNETAVSPIRLPNCIVTGAMIGPAFVSRLAQYADAITYLYGSTEAGALCSTRLDPTTDANGGFDVGRPHAGVEVEILADDGTPLPTGLEGRVRVRSPALIGGYVGNAALSAGIFIDGWFHPGDTGFRTADGALRITGRTAELVNIGGVKRNPAAIEDAIRACPGIAEAACFAEPGPDGIDHVAAAVRLSFPLDLAVLAPALRRIVALRTGADTVPRRLYLVDAIPRNANGKTQRHLLAAAVQGAAVVEIPASG